MSLKGSNGHGPADPLFIMILLNGSGSGSANSDPVTAHDGWMTETVRIKKCCAHFFTIFCPQHKDMANFNPPCGLKGAATLRGRVSGLGLSKISLIMNSKIFGSVHIREMEVLFIRAYDKVRESADSIVR